MPKSKDISSVHASLSMLFLKFIGCSRLTHIDKYDQEPGLGVFAGLNILPKPTYMNTYSCRCSEKMLMSLQAELLTCFKKKYPEFYSSDYINLDFHSIPHFGDDSEMEKVWCGARNKTMKGANTVFVQDSQSNAILYTRADILRNEEHLEVKKFIDYWKKINKKIDETLVFDCKFTTYQILDEIAGDNIKFITLRKRYAKLINDTLNIPSKEWKKVYPSIPKRKYKHVSVIENEVKLNKCENTFRQIIIKDHGRSKPTFIITNNNDIELKILLQNSRQSDLPARYGGEELAIILAEIPIEKAIHIAERLRLQIFQYYKLKTPAVTISIGVSTFCKEMISGHELIKAADKALYAAKVSGRNKVVSQSGL